MKSSMLGSNNVGMTTNDWIYANLIFSLQHILLNALITQPINHIFDFIKHLLSISLNFLGLTSITISGKLLTPTMVSYSSLANFQSSALDYLLVPAPASVSKSVINGKLIPSGWIISGKCFGTVTTVTKKDEKNETSNDESNCTLVFKGYVFPYVMKHFNNLLDGTHVSSSVGSSKDDDELKEKREQEQEKTIRVIESTMDKHEWMIPITQVNIPCYVLLSQQKTIDSIMNHFHFLKSRSSLRGSQCSTVLLTGKQGSGKTILVQQLVHQLAHQLSGHHGDSILVTVKSMNDESLVILKRNIGLIRATAGTSHRKDKDSNRENKFQFLSRANVMRSVNHEGSNLRKEEKKSTLYTGPIVILIDEWDSVISESIPTIPDTCIARMKEDGLQGEELTRAIEELQTELSNTSPGTIKTKRTINAFMDYLSSLDNTVTIFISNTSMKHVNSSFLRDGRITQHIGMPTLSDDDVDDFLQFASKEYGWNYTAPDVTPTNLDKKEETKEINKRRSFSQLSVATLVQIVESSKTLEQVYEKLSLFSSSSLKKSLQLSSSPLSRKYIEFAKENFNSETEIKKRRNKQTFKKV
jgi:hypothetical protein